jgi:hypothetical protein
MAGVEQLEICASQFPPVPLRLKMSSTSPAARTLLQDGNDGIKDQNRIYHFPMEAMRTSESQALPPRRSKKPHGLPPVHSYLSKDSRFRELG